MVSSAPVFLDKFDTHGIFKSLSTFFLSNPYLRITVGLIRDSFVLILDGLGNRHADQRFQIIAEAEDQALRL